MARVVKIAPSLLSADFGAFRDAAIALSTAGADYLHLDVMDGQFVPNITFGPPLLKALRPHTSTQFDCHLMIVEPERFIDGFVDAGADMLSVHPESCVHLDRVLHQIRDVGCRPAVALNPSTPIESIEWVLPLIDRVLVMTVNPGFGGQSFIPGMLRKLRLLRDRAQIDGLDFEIAVDGGVDEANARAIVDAGADVLIAGTAVFAHSSGVAGGIAALRAAVE